MILDGELLQRYAKHHDQHAFAELVRRHLDGIYSAALRRVGNDTHLAEDIVQQVFVQLARQAARLAHHPVLTGWLYITTRNQAAMAVRAEQRRRAREEKAHLMKDDFTQPGFDLDWNRIAPVLDWAIDQLAEADRTLVQLRYFARRPFDEIGRTLQVSPDAARMRVDRATEKLRTILARRGIASTAALLSAELAQHAMVAAPPTLVASATAAALATAPATLSALATAFHFMTTSKLVSGIATSVFLLGALGTVGLTTVEKRGAEAEAVSARERTEAAAANLRTVENRLQAATTETTKLEKVLADEESKRVALEAEEKSRAAAQDPQAMGKAFLEGHPEVKEALANSINSKLAYQWSPLFAALHFTPEQISEFQVLMRQGFGIGRPLDPDGRSYAMLMVDDGISPEERQRRLSTLLGPKGWKKFHELEIQRRPREIASQAASVLAFTDSPLTSEQSNRLMRLFSENQSKGKTNLTPTFDWNAIIANAAAILSPSQLTAVSGLRAKDDFLKATVQMTGLTAAKAKTPGK